MPVVAAIPYVVAAAATTVVYSTVEQKRAANAAAATDTAVAGYNAKVDLADADQIDMDTQANLASMRKDASVYLSRQAAAYAGAGVRTDTGSPLVVQAATAGRFAMQQQQLYTNAQAKEQRLASSAKAGIAEGQAAADSAHMQGVAAVLNGAGKVASQLGGAYNQGLFSGGSAAVGTGTTNLSAGLGGYSGD